MNNNKFLTLLMGECWHEWYWKPTSAWSDKVYLCTLCGERSENVYLPDHLSNPLPVIRWMEKEMPEVWRSYIIHCIPNLLDEKNGEVQWFNSVLDLSNLITYLSEHREWGWDNYETERGRIMHPALIYLEASCEKK